MMALPLKESGLGVGIYSVPEASRYTGVSPSRIRRWLRGYTFRSGSERHASPAVWRAQFRPIDGKLSLGFLDMLEVRFVDAFLNKGVGWKTIRLVERNARHRFNTSHPFCTKQFLTDGRTIFAEELSASSQSRLLDLVNDQFAFRTVLRPYLTGLEYDQDNNILRWWPLGNRRLVVIDPERSFGQPIVHKWGVPTAVLAAAHYAGMSPRDIARWYDVSNLAVRDAIEFEQRDAA